MAIDPDRIVELVGTAGRLVGLKEILRVGELNPGVQTELKRLLRDLVKEGRLVRDGKRYGVVGQRPERKSGPAWLTGKPAGKAKAVAAPSAPMARGRFRRDAGVVGFVDDPPRGKKGASGAQAAAPAGRGTKQKVSVARTIVRPQLERPRPGSARHREPDELELEVPEKKGPPKTRPTHGKLVQGIIHHHSDGFAFVKPIVGQVSEDLFIPPEEARKALDHDHVTVEVVPGRGGKTMGRIVEVTARTRQLVVGTYFENARSAWVQPRESELGTIRVPPTQLARPGDAVRVRLGVGDSLFVERGQLTGEVSGSLGSPDDHSVEVLSIAFARGFHDEFPPEVMDEADAIPIEVSEVEAKGEKRRDLRKLQLVTIDGEDARDFDDAIFVEDHARGFRLVVAIADVSHYVTEHSAIDVEGLRRATSVYLPGRVLPMLPERLSNGICSLKPDVDRLCMVADMIIDRSGTTVATELYPAVMRSHARCTYTEVHKVLNGEHVAGRSELKGLFEKANTLAKILTRMRLDRGAIDFDLPENRVVLNEAGLPTHMAQRERWESHRLVEECMLAANESVARFFREQGAPTVNRYHGEPDEEKLATFLNLLKAYGIEVQGELTSKELNRVLAKLVGHPEQRALHQLALRSMMQAVYSSEQSGHYGLGAEDYLHFTSPIRRYPDLLVHRLLKLFWSKKRKLSEQAVEQESERLEVLAVQCSERERAAMHVEREVSALYACLLMKDRVGEEFAATVGGLSEHGFFVVLDDHHVEGFVKGESVFPDFELDAATYRMNFGSGQQLRVGQKVKVMLASVNLQKKQMEFTPIEIEGFDSMKPARQQPRSRGPEPRNFASGKFQQDRGRGGGGTGGGKKSWKSRGDRDQAPRGGAQGRREERRSPQPPPGGLGVGPKPPLESTQEERPRSFDARAVLDRLWKERGGAPAESRSSRSSSRGDRDHDGRDGGGSKRRR